MKSFVTDNMPPAPEMNVGRPWDFIGDFIQQRALNRISILHDESNILSMFAYLLGECLRISRFVQVS